MKKEGKGGVISREKKATQKGKKGYDLEKKEM